MNARNITIAKANLNINDLNFKAASDQRSGKCAEWLLRLGGGLRGPVKAKQSALDVAQQFYEDNKKQVQIGTHGPAGRDDGGSPSSNEPTGSGGFGNHP